MGQKINPISIRLGYTAQWRSRWFDLKNYRSNLLEDYNIRQLLKKDFKKAAITKIEIERLSNETIVSIHTSRPGVLIGRGGAGVDKLRQKIKQLTGKNIKIDIIEVKSPETNAAVIAYQIVEQIERRIPFRRAIRGALQTAEQAGVDGIKIVIAGRLNGAEIARRELFIRGKIPLHTFRHYIDYTSQTAYTTYGTVGVKVWVFKENEPDVSVSNSKINQQ